MSLSALQKAGGAGEGFTILMVDGKAPGSPGYPL